MRSSGPRAADGGRDPTQIVMRQRGLGTKSRRLRVTMRTRVCAAFTSMRRRGLLVSEKEGKGLQVWRLR